MIGSYGSMPAFEEVGVTRAVTRKDAKAPSETHETRFHLTFSRPDVLSFEYGEQLSLSARGAHVTDAAGTTYPSVDDAIRTLSKASLGVSRLVPSMLLGRGNYPWPEELWSLIRWVRVEEVAGEPCDVLALELADGGEWDLWIEQSRHILRRTHKSGHLDDGMVELTVEYDSPTMPAR
jgi:hypothetical protein